MPVRGAQGLPGIHARLPLHVERQTESADVDVGRVMLRPSRFVDAMASLALLEDLRQRRHGVELGPSVNRYAGCQLLV